jgi:hypothetical protein
MEKPKIHLGSLEEYRTSVLKYLEWMLRRYYQERDLSEISMEEIEGDLLEINAYENLEYLEPIDEEVVTILDDDKIDTEEAEKAVLEGKILWEHTAAGEATRLGLGTKYLLNLSRFSVDEVVFHMKKEAQKELEKQNVSEKEKEERLEAIEDQVSREQVLEQMGGEPNKLGDISLGNRHMFQLAFDVQRLANKHGVDPEKALAKQKNLVILNEQTAEEILEEFKRFNFFGFDPNNTYFMVQRAFHGIYLREGGLFFDITTERNKRLHNHGQLMMQKTHDEMIFQVDQSNLRNRKFLFSQDFEELLAGQDDLLSYNVEDLAYLNQAIDLPSLALALKLKEQGYNMTMEIVANNPIKPQKGGACFYDARLKRVVMIESNQLKDIKNEEIKHLNKNFNHYIDPVIAFRAVREKGLPLSFDIKSAFNQSGETQKYIYPCPVQGDVNFLVKTAFVMRKNIKPISNWKSPATTPAAVKAMLEQDAQKGFLELVEKVQNGE